jgi:hypothetical protein
MKVGKLDVDTNVSIAQSTEFYRFPHAVFQKCESYRKCGGGAEKEIIKQ